MQHPFGVYGRGNVRVEGFGSQRLKIGLYSAAFAIKLTGFFVMDIMVLLADALHPLSGIIISSFPLVGPIWSQREADEGHMFGYGRTQNAAALVAATIFISFTSLTLFEEAIPELLTGAEPAYKAPLAALAVIGIAMILQFIPLLTLPE